MKVISTDLEELYPKVTVRHLHLTCGHIVGINPHWEIPDEVQCAICDNADYIRRGMRLDLTQARGECHRVIASCRGCGNCVNPKETH
jgi:hypothetical protein